MTEMKAVIDGIEYSWVGTLGALIESYEPIEVADQFKYNAPHGNLGRIIDHIPFHAVERVGAHIIKWAPPSSMKIKQINQFYKDFFVAY